MRPLVKVMLALPLLLGLGLYYSFSSGTAVDNNGPRDTAKVNREHISDETERHLLSVIEQSASRIEAANSLIEGYTTEIREKQTEINQLTKALDALKAEIPNPKPPAVSNHGGNSRVSAPAKPAKLKGPPQMPQIGDPNGKTSLTPY